jgi:hypothetical protein
MSRSIIIALGTVLGGLVLYVGSTTLLGIVGKEPWLSIAFIASFIVAGVLTALVTRRASPPAEILTIDGLEKRGLLIYETYEATRAFQVEEFEDEGCQYFVELKQGPVMFLCGQYLYDYEPADGRWEAKRPRRFPCTEFTLLRHKETRDILDVVCGGAVLEPEFEAPHFTEADFGSGRAPEDGQIISDRGYDQIKRDMVKAVHS